MRAVLFDWDGTLVDTLPYLWEATLAVVRHYGLEVDEARYRAEFAPDWRLLYRRFGLPEEEIEPAGRLWWTVYRGGEEGDLLPGAREALVRLRAAGIPIALVTAGSRVSVEGQLRRLAMAELLPVRVYGDDMPEAKPHPAPLLAALRMMGLEAEAAQTAYVGDSLDDVRMAIAVGARPVGITSDLADEATLRAAGAADVADSVAAWVCGLLAGRV